MPPIHVDPSLTESGFPRSDPPANKQLPAGGGKWVAPHYLQFNTFLNWVSRTYYWTHDEALRDSTCNAEAMWRDLVISTAIRDRQRPVCQLEHQFEARDPSDPQQKDLANDLNDIFEDIPRFQDMKLALLEAIWLGRAGVQVVCKWPDDVLYPRPMMFVRDWSPVHGDSIVFKFDGQTGIMCNTMLTGRPQVERIESRGGCAYFLTPKEEEVFLVHEFEPMAAPFFHTELAGQVHGSGYRGRVYWYWWLKHNLMKILMDFVRKAGNGFFLAGYEPGNRTELANMRTALEQQTGQPNIYVPMAQGRSFKDVLEHLPVQLQGADFQWEIISGLNELIRNAILGEIGTTRGMTTGLSSDMGSQHGITADERVKYDAEALEYPLQKLTNLICKYIRPGVRPPKFRFLADKRNPGEVMESATFFAQMGGALPKNWVQEQLGIPDPQPGEETLGYVQSQQAVAMGGGTPAGIPMAGPAGPAPGMDQGGGQDADMAAMASQIQPVNMERNGKPHRLAEALSRELREDLAKAFADMDRRQPPTPPQAPPVVNVHVPANPVNVSVPSSPVNVDVRTPDVQVHPAAVNVNVPTSPVQIDLSRPIQNSYAPPTFDPFASEPDPRSDEEIEAEFMRTILETIT